MTGGGAVARGRRLLLGSLGFYQRAVSPNFPPRCRFTPSCSAYAVEAIQRHGARRGGWLAARRLLRCAPWHPGGVDLVPEPPQHADRPEPPEQPEHVAGPGPGRAAEHRLEPGTDSVGQSSGTAGPPAAATAAGVRRPHRGTPPAPGRTPQQEAGVA